MALSSWVPGADGSGFPAEHLPWGIFSTEAWGTGARRSADHRRVGVRIGDHVLDLARLADAGIAGLDEVRPALVRPTLNPLMALGPDWWAALRERVTELVCGEAYRAAVEPALVPLPDTRLHLPIEVADYVDFYSSIEHATNLGRLFRPEGEPLLPNWRHLPVGYHGRAGTVVVSGTPVARPSGQRRAGGGPAGEVRVVFGPTERLDIELEVGVVVGTPSTHGEPVPVSEAPQHVFGLALVNDWTARDIQAWEYQPLGPFLGKSFATTMAAWITPLAALDGCRVRGPRQDPEPLPYLRLADDWGLALDLSVSLAPAGSTGETVISRSSFADLYWQFPQHIAHLTVNGASLRTGDLLASGTVSGPERGSEGSLIELTSGGTRPLAVGGTTRTFLEDGDEVVLRATAGVGDQVTIALGEAAGRVVPAGRVPAG
jgi:fumarylacetoacetase